MGSSGIWLCSCYGWVFNRLVKYGEGYSDIKANRDVPLQWVVFLQEILKHGSLKDGHDG